MKKIFQSAAAHVRARGFWLACLLALASGTWQAQTLQKDAANVKDTAKVKAHVGAMPENFHAPDVKIAGATPAGKDLVLQLTMINRGPGNFRVLKWNLPDGEELTSNLFTITCNGKEVDYHGKMVKRRVTAESYRTLAPGRKYSVRINLSTAYDVAAAGSYKIQYRVINQSAPDVSETALTDIVSNQIEVDK